MVQAIAQAMARNLFHRFGERREGAVRTTTPLSPKGNAILYAFLVLALIGFSAVGARLFQLQVRDSAMYKRLAQRQSELRVTVRAERGAVEDCNGRTLVASVRAWSFGADPTQVKNPRGVAEAFSRIFGTPASVYMDKLAGGDTRFVWLERGVNDTTAQRLANVADQGIVRMREPECVYDAPLAKQVIGETNVDNEGISGIELEYDSLLRGRDGFVVFDRDGLGRKHPDAGIPQIRPQQGETLELTIDATYQDIVESELRRGVARAGAAAGTAVMLDPNTGEVLAMASYAPTANDRSGQSAQASARNRAVTDVYEPGSVFKIVAAAAALQQHLVTTDERFNAGNGSFQLQDVTITDDHPFGELTFAQAFAQSSNICFAKLSQRFRPPVFYKYVRDFGFGIPTGVDLPGEVRGSVPQAEGATPVQQAYNAFGYGVAVTPLQLACAYAAIADGGVLMKPFVVKERRNAAGACIGRTDPQEVRRILAPQTAAVMTALLRGVVERGTGMQANLSGVAVAGKTGTSEKAQDGTYSKRNYYATFAGFFPADQPQIVLVVMLDSPRNGYYGGEVSAPIFHGIAERVIGTRSYHARLSGAAAPAHAGNAPRSVPVPDVRFLGAASARQVLAACGLRLSATCQGGIVIRQTPAPGTFVVRNSTIGVSYAATQNARGDSVPDMRGYTVRQAVNMFYTRGIPVHVVGSGLIARQVAPAASASQQAWTLYGSVAQ